MLNIPAHIDTPRLALRALKMSDGPQLFQRYARDAVMTRYLSWRPARTLSDLEIFLHQVQARRADHLGEAYGLWRRDLGCCIGTLGFDVTDHGLSMGYALLPDHWGQGFASEGLHTLIAWALEQPGIYRIEAYHHPDNPASGRVMQKAGMIYEGCLKRFVLYPNLSDEPQDSLLYAITRP